MKTTVLFKKGILTLLLVSVGFFTNAQIIVDNNVGTNADYTSLQAALDVAADNDTIYVQPSATSYGDIALNKPVTIIGRSHSEPSNRITKINTISINPNGSNTNLKGLNIFLLQFGINGVSEDIIVEECRVSAIYFYPSGSSNILLRGNYIGSIGSGNYSYVTNLNISQNIITGFLSVRRPDSAIIMNNLFLSYNITNVGSTIGKLLIQNCMFITKSTNLAVLEISDAQLDNCLTYNFGSGTYDISADAAAENMITTNMLENTDPMFTQIDLTSFSSLYSIENDYTLQAGSPAIGAGTNSEDIGIFGNGYSFDTIGNPSGYPIVDILTSTSAVPENGNLSVTISAKSK